MYSTCKNFHKRLYTCEIYENKYANIWYLRLCIYAWIDTFKYKIEIFFIHVNTEC